MRFTTRPQELHAELEAVGLSPVSVGASSIEIGDIDFGRELTEDEQTLADLVVAANRKGVGDPEIIDLRNYLGSDSEEWVNYVAIRKEWIDHRRRKKYADKVDLLFDRLIDTFSVLDYNGNKVLVVNEGALQKFKLARQAIKNEIPYPDGS